jgi:hypothetical protein
MACAMGQSTSCRGFIMTATLLVFLCLMCDSVPLQSQPDRSSSVVRVGTQTESIYNPASTHNNDQYGVASKLNPHTPLGSTAGHSSSSANRDTFALSFPSIMCLLMLTYILS